MNKKKDIEKLEIKKYYIEKKLNNKIIHHDNNDNYIIIEIYLWC